MSLAEYNARQEERKKLGLITNFEKTISIIIPVYNGEKYLRQCIDSCLSQNYPDKEIIVVDDGSTDSTKDIMLEYDGIHQSFKVNGGTASALNSGIRSSRGEWIKWLSADDVFCNDNVLTNMINHLSQIGNSKYNTIFYTHYDRINSNGDFICNFFEPERNESDLWNFFYGNGSTSLIHKSVFKRCGMFDDSLKHSEDYEFWLRCTQLYETRLQLLPMKSIKYRIHDDQLTNRVGGSLDDEIKKKIKKLRFLQDPLRWKNDS